MEEVVAYDKDEPGAYELGDANENVIYVGSADKLKRRLMEHVNETENDCIRRNAKKYRFEYTARCRAREKELYDAHVSIHGRPPSCNKVAPSGY